MGMKETENVSFDSMPPLTRGLFLTKEQAEKIKEPFKDVMSVVRCKDCKYGEDWGVLIACGKARGFGLTHDKDWFCADGERKE